MLIEISRAEQILGENAYKLTNWINDEALSVYDSSRVFEREIFALERMQLPNVHMGDSDRQKILDYISGNSEDSSVFQKYFGNQINIPLLSGSLLIGKTKLFVADVPKQKLIGSSISNELGLSGWGVSVLVGEDIESKVSELNLETHPEGNVIAISGSSVHKRFLEALALYAYGCVRETAAASLWLEKQLSLLSINE